MSKSKLGWLVFFLAFGVNLIAFLFFQKNGQIEENKTIWLYELPKTAAPMDAYVTGDFGPAQALTGTLMISGDPPMPGLADSVQVTAGDTAFKFSLDPTLTFSDDSPITAQDLVDSMKWSQDKLRPYAMSLPMLWKNFLEAKIVAEGARTLLITFQSTKSNKVPAEHYLAQLFTSPWLGAIHSKNLTALKLGQAVTKEWIASGPYKIRRWRPKEIVLVSRVHYSNGVKGMAPEYFRVLKFQSAPVKNPSADFVQATTGEQLVSDDHREYPTGQMLGVYWICRSHANPAAICADINTRRVLKQVLDVSPVLDESTVAEKNSVLQGKLVRYRIPEGSDRFRSEVRKNIVDRVARAGGQTQETSFLFENSVDTDLELVFVSTPAHEPVAAAEVWAQLSSRLAATGGMEHALGLVGQYPQSLQIKGEGKKRELNRDSLSRYQRVFLIPDPVPETLKF